jgi:hypothetical protein
MIDRKEEIYLTKSDKLSDESNVGSWFTPFDSRGLIALIAIIGALGTVIAIYTATQSKKIRNLIALMSLLANIPLIEASPMLNANDHNLVEESTDNSRDTNSCDNCCVLSLARNKTHLRKV